jgi:hypothetical protein
MNVEHLRAARNAVPFVPFTIYMADGRSHRIPHPDYLSMSPGGRTVIAYQTEEAGCILNMNLVTDIQFENEATSEVIFRTSQNGNNEPS